jgi:beta-galactosidase
LKTNSFETKNGLAAATPSSGLPSFLKFGPTPQGESVKVSRSSVKPVSAVAGANTQNAQMSYDDNELTEWSNNDSLSTGWIRYTLEREANIGEVCMKLSRWRTISYPIFIMVGDKEVFKGETERSLGYITIPFEPVKGKEITVKRIGVNSVNNVFNLVEVTEQKDQETVKYLEENKQGSLKIVEIELYEKVDQK